MDIGIRRNSRGEASVVATPSQEGGAFVINNDYYGDRVIDEVELGNVPEDLAERVEAGDATVYDELVEADPARPGTVLAVGNTVIRAEIIHAGSGNSTSVHANEVRELMPFVHAPAQVS